MGFFHTIFLSETWKLEGFSTVCSHRILLFFTVYLTGGASLRVSQGFFQCLPVFGGCNAIVGLEKLMEIAAVAVADFQGDVLDTFVVIPEQNSSALQAKVLQNTSKGGMGVLFEKSDHGAGRITKMSGGFLQSNIGEMGRDVLNNLCDVERTWPLTAQSTDGIVILMK